MIGQTVNGGRVLAALPRAGAASNEYVILVYLPQDSWATAHVVAETRLMKTDDKIRLTYVVPSEWFWGHYFSSEAKAMESLIKRASGNERS